VPLVLHGGSGIASASLVQAIALGVAKVNYGTYLKQRCLAAMRQALAAGDGNPHHLLGDGGGKDLVVVGRHAVRDAVLERIELLGCCGKA
jgi:fructose/tagatose bisphosphate aldolase